MGVGRSDVGFSLFSLPPVWMCRGVRNGLGEIFFFWLIDRGMDGWGCFVVASFFLPCVCLN